MDGAVIRRGLGEKIGWGRQKKRIKEKEEEETSDDIIAQLKQAKIRYRRSVEKAKKGS